MPKIIDEAQNKILAAARRQLFEAGYTGLSVRQLARECGIAVGTVYNYFKDKDTLVATVMMEDWVKALAEMDRVCRDAADVAAGFAGICAAIRAFAGLYESVWDQFSKAGGSSGVVNSRHRMLREQIAARIQPLLERLGKEDAAISSLLAETILSAAMQPDIGPDQIARLASRLL